MSQETFCYLITTGWKSGQPHTIEIWYVEHVGCAYLVAETRDKAHWVQNIRQQPQLRYAIGTRAQRDSHTLPWQAGLGRALEPPADAALIQQVSALMDAKYNWSAGLIVQLCPQA